MLDRILARYGYVRASVVEGAKAESINAAFRALAAETKLEEALSKPREYPRINNGADAIVRGQRWEQFYSEEGGLRDMIAGLRQSYFEKYASLKPGDIPARERLALIDYLAQELDGKVRAVIETGKLRTPR